MLSLKLLKAHLLHLQLPPMFQQSGLGPAQICSEAYNGDDVGLQLRGQDMYIHFQLVHYPMDPAPCCLMRYQ